MTEDSDPQTPPDPARIAKLRAALRENFGKIVLAMMVLPRYRHQHVGDLQASVLDPMLRDRIAIAYPTQAEGEARADMTGFAIWASVSEEVDTRIREQIASGMWPLRLRPEDWKSGEIHWLLDVVARDKQMAATVIANLRKLTGSDTLHLHPVITRLVEPDMLQKLGLKRTAPEAESADQDSAPDTGDAVPTDVTRATPPTDTRH